MSTKITMAEINKGDFIDIIQHKIKGIVEYVNLPSKYFGVITEEGVKYTYLQATDEIIKSVASKELIANLAVTKISRLNKTISAIGSDPEMFVVDEINEVIPSYLFLKSKEEKDLIEECPLVTGSKIGASAGQPIFWDGMQAEFNLHADACLSWTVDSAYHGLSALLNRARKFDKKAKLTIQPTKDILPHYIKEGKEEHVQFGCMPSKNVYGMEGIKADGRDVPFRSAGGHIHFGLDKNQKDKVEKYVKALDAILGVACVSMFGSYDDARRREYYGLAGEYRTPAHGLEYRSLSNVWMCHPVVMNIVFELSRKVISMVDSGLFDAWDASEEEAIEAINNCNIPLACEILKRNEKVFKALLNSFIYNNKEKIEVVYKTFLLGVENLIENPDDVEGNWNLGKNWSGHNETDGKKIGNMQSLPFYKKLLEYKI